MNWKRLLAHISGSVNQELLLQNEYLVTENRILRNRFNGRLHLTDPDRISLAEIGWRIGRNALAEVAQIVRQEAIRGWRRKLPSHYFAITPPLLDHYFTTTGCPAWIKPRTFEANRAFSEGEPQGNLKVSQRMALS